MESSSASRTGGAGWAWTVLASLLIVSGCNRRALSGGEAPADAGSVNVADALAQDGSTAGAGDANAGDANDADATAPGDPDAAVAPCAQGQVSSAVAGTIDHRAVRIGSPLSSSDGFPVIQESWSILRAASADEAVLAWGEGGKDGGVQHDAGAVIVVPNASSQGSTHYCAASVDAEATADAGVAIVLSDLSRLGQCPGTPVPGGVAFCTDKPPADAGAGACAAGFGVSGTVDGIGLDIRNQGGFVSGGEDATTGSITIDAVIDGNDEGVVLFNTRSDGIATGWLRVPNGSASNAGTVYCLADGRSTQVAEGVFSITFDSVGRLGACPGATPVDGQLGLCRMY